MNKGGKSIDVYRSGSSGRMGILEEIAIVSSWLLFLNGNTKNLKDNFISFQSHMGALSNKPTQGLFTSLLECTLLVLTFAIDYTPKLWNCLLTCKFFSGRKKMLVCCHVGHWLICI